MISWRQKTFDELPALSVRGRELRRSMRTVTVAWMFGIAWASCVSGSQFAAYARMIGLTDWDFGLLATLPFVGTIGQFAALVLIERTGIRKYQFLHTQMIGRSLWMVVAAIPLLLPVPSRAAVWTMMAVLLVVYVMDALSSPAWLTWMGYLIPRRVRARYFARRAQLSQVVQIIVVITVGVVVDRLGAHGAGENVFPQPVLLYGICVILAVGSVFGMTDTLLFRRIREIIPPAYSRAETPMLSLLAEPFKNRAFRHYAMYWTAFTFTMTIGAWYYWLCATELLGFSKLATNILFLVVVPVTSIVSSGWWGRAVDRVGRKPILILGGAGMVLSIVPWLIASPHMPNPGWIVTAINWFSGHIGALAGRADWAWADAHTPISSYLICLGGMIIGGTTWSGLSLAQTSVVLGFSDGQGRSSFVVVAAVLTSIGGILGGVVGGYMARWLEPLHAQPLRWGPLLWTNWHILFAAAMVIRAVSLLLLRGMPDPGATPTMNLVRVIRSNIANNVMSVLFYPLRVFGWKR